MLISYNKSTPEVITIMGMYNLINILQEFVETYLYADPF